MSEALVAEPSAAPVIPPQAVSPAPLATQPATPATTPARAPTLAAAPEPEGGDRPSATPATWPDDWRQKLAGEDKAALKTLERFTSPENFAKAYGDLRKKVSEGEVVRPLPKDATPEDVAAWRKERGVPEKPEDYKIDPGNGIVIGEADKPLVDSFSKFAHEKHWTPDRLNEAVSWYYAEQQAQEDRRLEQDEVFKAKAQDALREEWGPEFRRNINAVQNLLSTAPKGFAERFLSGRTGDGRMIGDDPDALRWLAQISREMNPAASLVPAGTTDNVAALSDEIAGFEKRMREDRKGWFNDAKSQERYRELLNARQKIQARG